MKLLKENEKNANLAAAKVMRISTAVLAVVFILNVVGIFIVDMTQMMISCFAGAMLLMFPTLLVNVMKKSDKGYSKYAIVFCAIVFTGILTVIMPKHTILLYVYPIAISSLYFSGKLNICSTVFTIVIVSAAQLISFYIPCDKDANFTDFKGVVLYGIVPRAMILFAISLIFTMLCKRTASLLGNLMSAEQQEQLRAKSSEISKTLVQAVNEMNAISAESAVSNRTITDQSEIILRDSEANSGHIQSVSENMNTISENLKNLAKMSDEIQRLLKHSEEVTEENERSLAVAEKSMKEIYSYTDESMRVISELSAQSKQISDIIKVIEDISTQTDILAINASIEAAHAGAAGKGFSIVADEIHVLSDKTKESVKDIADIISRVTSNITNAVSAMEKNFSLTRDGMENMEMMKGSAEKISDSNTEIYSNVGYIADVISNVAQSGDEVTNRLADVSDNIVGNCKAVSSVSDTIKKNSKNIDTLDSMVKSIKEMSEQLSLLAG